MAFPRSSPLRVLTEALSAALTDPEVDVATSTAQQPSQRVTLSILGRNCALATNLRDQLCSLLRTTHRRFLDCISSASNPKRLEPFDLGTGGSRPLKGAVSILNILATASPLPEHVQTISAMLSALLGLQKGTHSPHVRDEICSAVAASFAVMAAADAGEAVWQGLAELLQSTLIKWDWDNLRALHVLPAIRKCTRTPDCQAMRCLSLLNVKKLLGENSREWENSRQAWCRGMLCGVIKALVSIPGQAMPPHDYCFEARSALSEKLASETRPEVLTFCLEALGNMGPKALDTVPTIVAALQDSSRWPRSNTRTATIPVFTEGVKALAAIEMKAEHLLKLAERSGYNAGQQQAIVQALGLFLQRLPSPAVVDRLLITLKQDSRRAVQSKASTELRTILQGANSAACKNFELAGMVVRGLIAIAQECDESARISEEGLVGMPEKEEHQMAMALHCVQQAPSELVIQHASLIATYATRSYEPTAWGVPSLQLVALNLLAARCASAEDVTAPAIVHCMDYSIAHRVSELKRESIAAMSRMRPAVILRHIGRVLRMCDHGSHEHEDYGDPQHGFHRASSAQQLVSKVLDWASLVHSRQVAWIVAQASKLNTHHLPRDVIISTATSILEVFPADTLKTK